MLSLKRTTMLVTKNRPLIKNPFDVFAFPCILIVGSFFDKYPINRKLISLNKRNTGETNAEFNLRHDWNSLLTNNDDFEDELKFTAYSKQNFPHADHIVRYLEDYRKKFKLNVKYNVEISNVRCETTTESHPTSTANKRKCLFKMNDHFLNEYTCK